MVDHAQLRGDDDVPMRSRCYRPSLVIARGIKWTATWDDGTSHSFKTNPQTTKAVMANLALRWPRPPVSLQKDKDRPFDLASLVEESHSHVYLVRLLTFDSTADGRAYYKIGKAVSIPKRIKQFGPCQLVAEARLASEKESLKVEAHLHQRFAAWRKPETEIFCFAAEQVEAVRAAMTGHTASKPDQAGMGTSTAPAVKALCVKEPSAFVEQVAGSSTCSASQLLPVPDHGHRWQSRKP